MTEFDPTLVDELGYVTLHLGHCRLSLRPTERGGEAYVLFCFTPPEHRQEGSWAALRACLRWIADVEGWTLVSHPENAWIQASMEKTGWLVDPEREEWHGQPFMYRPVQEPEPCPEDIDKLTIVRPLTAA